MRSPYRQSAFFLLGTTADSSLREIHRVQRRMEVALQLGQVFKSSLLPFLRRDQLSREEILEAVHRLENGRSRLKEELFWVHAGNQNDCMPDNPLPYPELVAFLTPKAEGTGKRTAIAKHNLAVIYHALAFEEELNRAATIQLRYECWLHSYRYWRETH